MSLGTSDPMEKVNKFMGDGVFTEEGNLFDGVEDDGGFEDGGVSTLPNFGRACLHNAGD